MKTAGRLENKICLITGASQSIGLATGQLFAREGATVILADISDTRSSEQIKEMGPRSHFLALDVTDENQWIHVIEEIRRNFGSLNVLINGAGISPQQTHPVSSNKNQFEAWDRAHLINSEGVFLGSKYAIQEMAKKQSGTIVNVSSKSGSVRIPGAMPLSTVLEHTKSVALYCGKKGYAIRCNSISIAAIMTPQWEPYLTQGPDHAIHRDRMMAKIPLHRMGAPEEVAKAILFLASDESSFMTGSELVVDGGLQAQAILEGVRTPTAG